MLKSQSVVGLDTLFVAVSAVSGATLLLNMVTKNGLSLRWANDAFTELDTQRNRMSGFTKENSELKQEIVRLEDRINKTNIVVEFMLMTYLFVAIAKLIVALII